MTLDCEKTLRDARELGKYAGRVLGDLIRIPSPSCGEGDAIAYLEREMRSIGFDEVRVDRMGNLIGGLGEGERTLAFDAHVDVVGVTDAAQWTHDPWGGEEDGGCVWGRGSCDQKGAIASLLVAAKLIRAHSPRAACRVMIVITVQEEDSEGLCWRHLIEQEGLKPDAVVLTEPTALAIARGQKGKLQMAVETKGVGSHGSAPELGVNAIYRMAPIIAAVERLDASLPAAAPFRKGSVAVSRVESKAPSLCSVAEECRIYLDRRLTRGETKEKALAEIAALAAPHGGAVSILRYEKPSYRGLRCAREQYFPEWLAPEGEAVLIAAKKAHRALFGERAKVIVWDFSTNGNVTCGLHRIPTIGYGPGDPAMAHVRDERVAIGHLVSAAAFYAALPALFRGASKGRCGGAGGSARAGRAVTR